MSDYDARPGGSLKLKGGKSAISGKKKKKSSKAHADAEQALERERVKELLLRVDDGVKNDSPSGSARSSPVPGGSNDRKTEAEKRFEATQRQRMAERVAKMAKKTHKDRVNDFNAKLESLSEHHDIPKVGPG